MLIMQMVIIENGYGFSLQDMCEIADFDFFKHPFIPGQPLDYYEIFLKPLHDVLASYKKIWTNVLKALNNKKVLQLRSITLPQYDGPADYSGRIQGPDAVKFQGNIQNWLKQMKESNKTYETSQATSLGYQVAFQYQTGYWTPYR